MSSYTNSNEKVLYNINSDNVISFANKDCTISPDYYQIDKLLNILNHFSYTHFTIEDYGIHLISTESIFLDQASVCVTYWVSIH